MHSALHRPRSIMLACALASAAISAAHAQQGASPFQSAPISGHLRGAPAQPPAQTQQPAGPVRTETMVYDVWQVSCSQFESPARRACTATLRVFREGSTQAVMFWNIASAGDKKLTANLVTPTGVLIEPGVQFNLGGKPQKLSFTACDNTRCLANMPVDENALRAAAKAGKADAKFRNINGQDVTVAFPLNGMEKALAELRR